MADYTGSGTITAIGGHSKATLTGTIIGKGDTNATLGILPASLRGILQGTGTINGQSILNAVLAAGTINAVSTLIAGSQIYPLCDIRDSNDIAIDEIHFESILPGTQSAKQIFTIRNNTNGTLNLNLTSESLLTPNGTALETYLSTYFSSDNITYDSTLALTIPVNDTENFYIYYQPPSTGKVGEKAWQTDLGITPVPNVTLLEDWFYINPIEIVGGASSETDCPVVVELPYQTGIMSNFADLRFCLADGTELDWGISERTLSTSLKAVVTIPTLPATPATTMIYAYGANALAAQGYQSELADYGFADGTLPPWTTIQGGSGVTVGYNTNFGANVVNLKTYPTSPDDWEVAISRPAYDNYGTFKYTFAYDFYQSWLSTFFKPISTTNSLTGDGYGVRMSFDPSFFHNPLFSIVKIKNGTETTLTSFRPSTWTGGTKPLVTQPQELVFTRTSAGIMSITFNDVVLCTATDAEEFESNYMQLYKYCNKTYDLFIKIGDYNTFPSGTVTEGDWNFYLTSKTIKAGILYQNQDLPGLESEIKYGCRIGGVYYE